MNYKFGAVSIIVMLIACLWFFYPRSYGEFSDRANDLALACYGACRTKSDQRIEQLQAMLDDSDYSASLTPQEIRWLQNVLSVARSGRWQRAAEIAKQMLDDQVKPVD